jgi:glycosyltransferase involved in cell wall biosynthesis
MLIALLTEGGYPYARGESGVWCDRLLRGLSGHEFEVCALSRSRRQAVGPRSPLPPNVARVRTAPLWGPPPDAAAGGRVTRRLARRCAEAFAELTGALCTPEAPAAAGLPDAAGLPVLGPPSAPPSQADRFATGLYALADLAADHGGLSGWLRSERAVAVLEAACRAPGAPRAVHSARVADLLAVAERLERVLRPLSLDWYGMDGEQPGADPGLAAAQLCHAVGGGPAALPGLLTRHFYGTPLLITEYGVRLREHYLLSSAAAHAVAPSAPSAPVRALLASFQVRLAREAYAAAALITPGNTHTRRWQERCGADRERLRTVYPGMDARPFDRVGEAGDPSGSPEPPALVWVGRIEPAKDLIGLLHAFAEVRKAEPGARLRIVGTAQRGRPDHGYLAHCRSLAAQLFPDEAPGRHAVGHNPVTFDEVGGPEMPTIACAYAAGSVAVLSSVVEGFPVPLVEAMFCARPAVCTDVGAVCEVIGGTGLVVPPRNPRALADACVALLRDPERRARLGAAARARALELFTVEQNIAAFRSIYLELISVSPARWSERGRPAADVPFARPAEAHLPVRLPGAAPTWVKGPIATGPAGEVAATGGEPR